MLEINNFCNCFMFCFVVFFSSTFYVLCMSKFTMIFLLASKDTSLINCNNNFVIHWGICFIGNYLLVFSLCHAIVI